MTNVIVVNAENRSVAVAISDFAFPSHKILIFW
jgi:hypothetical protein